MSDTNEFQEFAELSESYKESSPEPLGSLQKWDSGIEEKKEEKEPKAGEVCQYALYRNGYMASTATVKKLHAGSYDIKVNSDGVYVTPLLPPTGILFDLPDLKSDDVMQKIEIFWNSEKDYKEGNEYVIGGAAFKSGVLLWGPQGSGKSSIIKLASTKLTNRGGIVFFADCNPAYVMQFLESFTRIEPNRKCIVILEDIDSLIRNYGDSGYLEMLDSAKSIDNVIKEMLFIVDNLHLEMKSVSGSPSSNHSAILTVSPDQTHEKYFKELHEYIDFNKRKENE